MSYRRESSRSITAIRLVHRPPNKLHVVSILFDGIIMTFPGFHYIFFHQLRRVIIQTSHASTQTSRWRLLRIRRRRTRKRGDPFDRFLFENLRLRKHGHTKRHSHERSKKETTKRSMYKGHRIMNIPMGIYHGKLRG